MKFSHLTRVYTELPLITGQTIVIDDEKFHYLKSVLRFRINSSFRLFNSRDGEFFVKILEINKANLKILVESFLRKPTLEKKLTLALCIIKPERMIEAIKGAVQLGVTEIAPIISERSQLKKIQAEKINRSMTQATEQSERFLIPKLLPEMTLDEFCRTNNYQQLIAAIESEDSSNTARNINSFEDNIAILIGPEGGFSDDDIDIIKSHKKLHPISLGNSVLRSEIAVISTIACVNMMRN